jgi:hypothetical protein
VGQGTRRSATRSAGLLELIDELEGRLPDLQRVPSCSYPEFSRRLGRVVAALADAPFTRTRTRRSLPPIPQSLPLFR